MLKLVKKSKDNNNNVSKIILKRTLKKYVG